MLKVKQLEIQPKINVSPFFFHCKDYMNGKEGTEKAKEKSKEIFKKWEEQKKKEEIFLNQDFEKCWNEI